MLINQEVNKLRNLIKNSFRVRANHDPIYVDFGGGFQRFSSQQHQVLFGRRGSGKSCLLIHFMKENEKSKSKIIYIGIDEIKKLGFPDILIRLLLSIFEEMPRAEKKKWVPWSSPLQKTVRELRLLLDEPETAQTSRTDSASSDAGAGFEGKSPISAKISRQRETETVKEFTSKKLDQIERHLQDYKKVLKSIHKDGNTKSFVLVDDFYLINREIQPDVADYLHRLCRDTDFYLKIATIRHRTSLRKHNGQTIGLELTQDVEEISLDKTFENFEATHNYLHAMLQGMADRAWPGLQAASLFNPDASRALSLASGGVPRDFLNIFVDAIDLAVQAGKTDRVTPTFVYKASSLHSYKSKLANIKEEAGVDSPDLERLYSDLLAFCLKEKRKTAFLIRRDEVQQFPYEHELLQQLMDFKLIHIIDQNTSAASGRSGRYAAYTLDFSIFMEPRLRNIEIVEFWKTDQQRRPVGIRESPEYSLRRAHDLLSGESVQANAEDIVESIDIDQNAVLPDTSEPAPI